MRGILEDRSGRSVARAVIFILAPVLWPRQVSVCPAINQQRDKGRRSLSLPQAGVLPQIQISHDDDSG